MGDDVNQLSISQVLMIIMNILTLYLVPIHNDVHVMIKVKLILTDYEGHRCRSKVTKNELIS